MGEHSQQRRPYKAELDEPNEREVEEGRVRVNHRTGHKPEEGFLVIVFRFGF